jgi:Ser-tRNA(Ala) deacylase AlaX
MKANKGRLQTGEHILARVIQNKVKDVKVVIAKFDKEEYGSVDFSSQSDLRELNLKETEKEVNEVIGKGLSVHDVLKKREEVEGEFDLSKIPDSIKEIRIVEVEGFDRRPCKDPHVGNTKEIGYFEISKLEKAGKDRYRFTFRVK